MKAYGNILATDDVAIAPSATFTPGKEVMLGEYGFLQTGLPVPLRFEPRTSLIEVLRTNVLANAH
jgi:hypothetical protein